MKKKDCSYPLNLIRDIIGDQDADMSELCEDSKGYISAVMKDTLCEREIDVIEMYYKNHWTYHFIGINIGVSNSRVGQIINKSLMKIRIKGATYHLTGDDSGLIGRIETIGLSRRALNALHRYHGWDGKKHVKLKEINYISDLIGVTEDELLLCRNLGKLTFAEIVEKFEKVGIVLENGIFVDKRENKGGG